MEVESLRDLTLIGYGLAKGDIEQILKEAEEYWKQRSKSEGLVYEDILSEYFFKSFKIWQNQNKIHGIIKWDGS